MESSGPCVRKGSREKDRKGDRFIFPTLKLADWAGFGCEK